MSKNWDINKCLLVGERAELLDTTNHYWAPTIDLGHDKIKNVSLAVDRNARARKRNEIKRKYDELTSSSTTQDSTVEEVIQSCEFVETETPCKCTLS